MPESPPPPTAPRVARWADHAAVGAFCAWAAALGTRRIAGGDVWWHLVTGRAIWEQRGLPATDIFTYAHAGAPWVNLSWLFDLGLFGVHQAGGVPALAALRTAMVLALAFGLVFACHRPGRSLLFLPVAMFGLGLHAPRFLVRPHVLSSLFTVLTIALIESDRRGRRGWLWGVVPIAWLWTVSHGAFPTLFVLLGAYGVELLLQARPRAGSPVEAAGAWRGRIRRLALIGLAAVAATLVQPHGWHIYTRVGEMMGSALWSEHLGEWHSTIDYLARSPALRRQGLLLVAGLAAGFLAAAPRISAFRLLATVGFGYLALQAIRHLDVFIYIAAPITILNLHDAVDAGRFGLDRPRWRTLRRRLGGAWAAVAVAYFTVHAARHFRPRQLVDGRPVPTRAWAAAPFAYPNGPVEHLLAHPTAGRLFNTFQHGGYLSWRLYPTPVLIDGKGLDEPQARAYQDAMRSAEAFAALVEQYDVRAVIMTLAAGHAPLFGRLIADPAWALEVFDPSGYLFTRRRGPPVSRIPPADDLAADLPAYIAEPLPPFDPAAGRAAPEPIAAQVLGAFWSAAGMPRRAARAYHAGIAASPHRAGIRLAYAETLLGLGETGPALAAVADIHGQGGPALGARADLVRARAAEGLGDRTGALAYAERAGPAAGEPGHHLRLRLLAQLGELDRAEAEGRRWLRRYPRSATARNDLAVVANLRGDDATALRLIEEAMDLEPGRGDLHYTRGLLLRARGDAGGAAAAFAEAAALGFTPTPAEER